MPDIHQAKKQFNLKTLLMQLENYGVIVHASSKKELLEEAPQSYKNIDDVIEVIHQSHIAKKIAKLKPLAIIKG